MGDATEPGADMHMPSEPRELITQKEYATRKGWSKQYINQLVRRGRIPLIDGKIDPHLADTALTQSRDLSRDASMRMTKVTDDTQTDDEDAALAGSPYQRAYGKVRVLREHYRAQSEKLAFEERTGQLVRSDHVREEAFTSGRLVRETLLGSVKEISVALNAELGVDTQKAATALRRELKNVLAIIVERLESPSPLANGLEPDDH